MRLAKLTSLFCSLLGTSLLFGACADQRTVIAASAPDSAPLAVDLGGSSRIIHVAGRAGEGEGYGIVQPAPTDHASMAGMSHQAGKPTAQTSMPAMDHNAMDHGSTPSMNNSGPSQPPGTGAQVAHAGLIQGSGMVNSVDPSARKINVSHSAIAAIGWPAMTMDFAVAPPVDLRQIKVGTNVSFTIERGGDGTYVIQSIMPAGGGH